MGMLILAYKFIQKNKGIYLLASIMFYGLAILSKESSYAFLGIIPLFLYYFSDFKGRKIILVSSAYLGLALMMLYLRSLFVDPSPVAFEVIDNSLIAIESPITRLATAIGMIGHYFYLLVFPFPLSFDYSFNQIPAIPWYHWKCLSTIALLLIMAWFIVKEIPKKNIVVFGLLFFGISFVITSNIFFLTGASFAERFLFIPSIGFCIAAGHMIYFLLSNRDTAQYSAGILICIVIGSSYTYKLIDRVPDWKSDTTLFSTGIRTAPNSSRAQSFYGKSFFDRALHLTDQALKNQYLDTAIIHFKKSISIYPEFTETYQHLAAAYEQAGKIDLAEESYRKGFSTNTSYYPALVNLGVLYLNQDRIDEGIEVLEKANALKPDHLIINKNLGIAYQKKGAFDLAIKKFEFVLEKEYSIPNLGSLVEIYRAKGEIEKAIAYDQEIKKLMQLKK
jgi:Tfp pilus assembly protein PilF